MNGVKTQSPNSRCSFATSRQMQGEVVVSCRHCLWQSLSEMASTSGLLGFFFNFNYIFKCVIQTFLRMCCETCCATVNMLLSNTPTWTFVYRYRVETSAMFAVIFIVSCLTAGFRTLGGGILPNTHRWGLEALVLLYFQVSRASFASLCCELCRWILQSDYIILHRLPWTDKMHRSIEITMYVFVLS